MLILLSKVTIKLPNTRVDIWKDGEHYLWSAIQFSVTKQLGGYTWISIKSTLIFYRNKLMVLTVVCFITMGLVFATDSQKSIGDSDVPGRIQFLLSFVLSAYVGLYISRFNNIRHNTLGSVWGNIETIALYSHGLFSSHFSDPRKGDQAKRLHATVERYCEAVFRLLFLGAQGKEDMSIMVEKNVLTVDEVAVLSKALVGTRPLVVLGWLSSLFEKVNSMGYTNFILINGVVAAISGARGGVGATMGWLGTPLPFIYTHLVYWIVQILLLVIAISTGINLAVYYDRRHNGDEMYSYDDDSKHWPASSNRFYGNYFLQQTAGNMIFAVFVEGLLFCCGEIENPMSTRSGGLPDECYFAFVHNNIKALTVGRESFETLVVNFDLGLTSCAGAGAGAAPSMCPEEVLHVMMSNGNGSSRSDGRAKVEKVVSADEIAEKVRGLGEVYTPYALALQERGVVGSVFAKLTADELSEDFGVNDKYNLRALLDLQNLCLNA